jgi:hypothetical protein
MARDSSDLALAIQPAQPFGIMNKNSVGGFLDTMGPSYGTERDQRIHEA